LKRADPVRGRYVLYWMQSAQRVEYNHALEYAIERANENGKPLVVFFGITDGFPEANLRHYRFMLEGLCEVAAALRQRGVRFVCRHTPLPDGALALSREAVLTVVDAGYLTIQKKWRANLARRIAGPLFQVETDVVVPVATVSTKEEFSARTLRPKITAQLEHFFAPLKKKKLHKTGLDLRLSSLDMSDPERILAGLKIDRRILPVTVFQGGTSRAKRRLSRFLKYGCENYHETARDPSVSGLSNMSPYLHFGQISPLYIALRVRPNGTKGAQAYLEELIVRRELSMNFVNFNPRYDAYAGLPGWAQETLARHAGDPRQVQYSLKVLEQAQTHDPYWNAAQQEMIATGKMHGYMRMYWGKKILEWTRSPQEAYCRALYLNNRYFLDGRDPNGFAGVAWCFGKHDRAWGERPVFGKVRYMNAKGLERKVDIGAYVEKTGQYYRRWLQKGR